MAFPIDPPIKPMLAKLARTIPSGEGWRYEPKWDGFRALMFIDGDTIRVDSRNGQPLLRYFPEMRDIARESLPARCVFDGEIVVPSPTGLDFDALQQRIHPAESRVRKLMDETPASFIPFDVLALDADLRDEPMGARRARLTESVDPTDRCFVTPHTDDLTTAEGWFTRFEGAGLDGLIAKRVDQRYVPGKREMVKIKHERTADCVVGGYRLNKDGDGVGSLLLGVYDDDGRFHFLGFTSSFKAVQRREMLPLLDTLRVEDAGEVGRMPGTPSRWSGGKDASWVPLEHRLVCEVAFDHLQGGWRFRHGTTFKRWRQDKSPSECTFDQFEEPPPFALEDIRALAASSNL